MIDSKALQRQRNLLRANDNPVQCGLEADQLLVGWLPGDAVDERLGSAYRFFNLGWQWIGR